MESLSESFQTIDFVIFIGLFLLSAGVGSIFAYLDRKKQTTENYYFGGRKISPFPVAVSIAVSFISAVTVIGIPAEVYLFGNAFLWCMVAIPLANFVAAIYYVPLFHRLQLNCVYEYLELRFHRRVRIFASVLGVVSTTMYLAITVYMPSLALSAVTPLKLTWTIALISATCTFYTTIGGMKAVIWTDVLQSLIMIAGMSAVFFRTLVVIGGLDQMLEAMERGGRNNFQTFDIDPRLRDSAWAVLSGSVVNMAYEFICSQTFVQRWLACKSIKTARCAVMMGIIPMMLYYALAVACGLAAYAYYEHCDLLQSGQISKPDQIIPRLAVEIFRGIPGLAGLLVAAALCGTLSTVSSGINSLAAVGLVDFVLGFFSNLREKRKLLLSKALTLCFGTIVMLVAYVISLSSSNAIQIVITVFGIVSGPILGVFTMGVFIPWINYKGALSGAICGMIFVAWLSIGALVSPITPEGSKPLPVSTDGCKNVTLLVPNITIVNVTESTTVPDSGEVTPSIFTTFHAISPFLYGLIGLLIALIGAHIASIFVGFAKPSEADPDLFLPILDNRLFPKRIRNFFRFGVPERKDLGKTSALCGKKIDVDAANNTEFPMIGLEKVE